jgi:IPT/TIG domain
MLRILRSLSPALAVVALAAPAAAQAAPVVKKAAATSKKASTKKKASAKKKAVKVAYPTVTSISPRKIQIGQKLTVTGTGFKPGKGRSSVAFYRSGSPVIFVKADSATTTKLVVTITPKVATLLAVKNDVPVATLLRLRVVGAKMSRTWTKNSRSPIVSPLPNAPVGQGGSLTAQQAAAQVYQSCEDNAKVRDNWQNDNDHDSIPNIEELRDTMDPCNPDTDGDTISDGYEWDSARDLNQGVPPTYPSRRPWPNPLDPSDINSDFDGDGLRMWQENQLWLAQTQGAYPVTAYSDGTQNSGGKIPTTVDTKWLDLDGDGNLTDDERDEDGDHLSNWIEYNARGTQDWWLKVQWSFKPHGTGKYNEPPYTARQFNDVNPIVWDTDGDGLGDGDDDQDNDGWPNFAEMQLTREEVGYRVNPYNPCLPDPHATTCSRHVPLDPGARWAPWDLVGENVTSQTTDDAIPFSWPAQINYHNWSTARPNPAPAPATFPQPAWNSPPTWDFGSAYQADLNKIHNDEVAGGATEADAWETAFGYLPGFPDDASKLNWFPHYWAPTAFGTWDPPTWFVAAWDFQGGAQG